MDGTECGTVHDQRYSHVHDVGRYGREGRIEILENAHISLDLVKEADGFTDFRILLIRVASGLLGDDFPGLESPPLGTSRIVFGFSSGHSGGYVPVGILLAVPLHIEYASHRYV